MTTLTRKRTRLTFHQVLQAAQALSPQEQRRLQNELAQQAGVYLMRPTGTAAAIRRGRRLAKQIQTQMSSSSNDSLDQVMAGLRGRSWSP
jgi:hypothetical protein